MISAKLRTAAIEILELSASNIDRGYPSLFAVTGSDQAFGCRLALAAWQCVSGFGVQSVLEAAALLRDGWSPGEQTYDLATGESIEWTRVKYGAL